jgi:hypothetical protein
MVGDSDAGAAGRKLQRRKNVKRKSRQRGG